MDVNNILIIASSGLTVLNYRRRDVLSEMEDILAAGLFSAIKSFLNSFHQELEYLRSTSLHINLLPSMLNKIVFVLVSDSKDFDEEISFDILEQIRDKIIENYQEHLTPDGISFMQKDTKIEMQDIIEEILSTTLSSAQK